jgi:hypothetical protein
MEEKLKEYVVNYKQNVDDFRDLQNYCFDRRNKTCNHEIKCSVRKYYNKFEGHEIFYPVPEEFSTRPKEISKVNYSVEVPDLNMESVSIRSNTLSELSIKNYKSCWNMWKKLELNIYDTKEFINGLVSVYSASSIATHIKTLSSYILLLTVEERIQTGFKKEDFYYLESTLDLLNKYIANVNKSGVLNDTQKENWVGYTVLLKVLDNIDIKKKQQEALLLQFVLKTVNMRSNFSNIKITNYDPETDTFIDFETKKLIVNKNKKNGKYYEYVLPEPLMKSISDFITTRSYESDYLFYDENKVNPFKQADFNKWITKFLSIELENMGIKGKKIGISKLRTIVNSSFLHPENVSSPNQDQIASNFMGHSVRVNKEVYLKK